MLLTTYTKETRKSTLIKLVCDTCNVHHEKFLKNYEKICSNKLYVGDYCNSCWRKILNNRPEYKLAMKEAMSVVCQNDDWRKKNSLSKKGIINIGNNNGMKSVAARKKASETRKRMFQDNANRKLASERMKTCWSEGKFDHVSVGKSKWYKHTKPNGQICSVQGTWELKYAQWLDLKGVEYQTHKDKLVYIDENGESRSYLPDFKLDDNKYVEIKSDYHLSLSPNKIDNVTKCNPNIEIMLLLETDLRELGVL